MRKYIKSTILTAVIVLISAVVSSALAADVGKISKEELKKALDDENVVILDARSGRDWSSSEFKIKGAIRANPSEFKSWAATYPKDKKLVLYCA